MPNTVETFNSLRRKQVYVDIANTAIAFPETSRNVLQTTVELLQWDLDEANRHVCHIIAFASIISFVSLLTAVFNGSLFAFTSRILATIVILYFDEVRIDIVAAKPAAKELDGSSVNVPPYTVDAGVFWF